MFKILEELIAIIRERRESSVEESYTKKLLNNKKLCIEKVVYASHPAHPSKIPHHAWYQVSFQYHQYSPRRVNTGSDQIQLTRDKPLAGSKIVGLLILFQP